MAKLFGRDDIKTGPEYPILIFGDFFFAQIIDMVQGKDMNGKDVWKLKLIPTKELAKKYDIGTDVMDENLTIQREYPFDMIRLVNSDPSWTVHKCELDFNGQINPIVSSTTEYRTILKVQGLRELNNQLMSENAYLREKLEMAMTNVSEFIKENIMNPAKELNIAQILQGQQQPYGMAQPTSPVRMGI